METTLRPIEPATDFEHFILDIIEDGGKKRFGLPHSVISLFRKDESAGFAHFDGFRLVRRIEIRRITPFKIEAEWTECGTPTRTFKRTFLSGGRAESGLRVISLNPANWRLESSCPVIDFLYRIAYSEFQKIDERQANLELLQMVERLMEAISKKRPGILSFDRGTDAVVWKHLQNELDRLALSQVHTWRERLHLSRKLKSEYRQIVDFKRRLHRSGILHLSIKESFHSTLRSIRRFIQRPVVNLVGLLDHLLLDPLRWFSGVVRSNMGYSIALAVYSPFTFFFITQPMNPHAMRAVEKVRNAGLSLIETTNVAPPAHPPESGNSGWTKRMEQFKSLQITLEGNLDYSQRVGRLEELETQLGWPIALQGAWDESTRYLASLEYLSGSNIDPDLKNLVIAEQRRLSEIRIYFWSRLLRFILDHRYIILDPDSELVDSGRQARFSLYLYSRITREITDKNPSLRHPAEAEIVLETARKNTPAPWPEVPVLRDRRKRYWESLYLMQSRNQESSNAGLQAYWWSIRNTVSALQSMIAIRREELLLLSLHPRPSPASRSALEERYRNLLHLMEVEFESLRPELTTSVPGDQEGQDRESLIRGIRNFLAERERLP
jgi:hypothetical protein